jgi:hypothetical protein
MTTRSEKDSSFIFLITGIVSLLVAVALMALGSDSDPARPALGWLIGSTFWLSGLIGMLFLLMIWWMFDSGWSIIIRRQIEHALSAFLPLGLILLPVVIFALLRSDNPLVPWVWMNLDAPVAGGTGTVAEDVLYIHKAGYLNKTFFGIRFVVFFLVWAGLAYFFRQWSFRMDETGDHRYIQMSRKLAAIGIPLCALATTFAAVDWFKTLEYHWFSTMYGVWYFSSSMRVALSLLVLMLFWLAKREDGLKGIVQKGHFYFLGCLMLAFTIFWAYISFCQYFLIYNANIPEETYWYNIRELGKDGAKNTWWWVSMVLVFCNFFIPFIYLLWHRNKFGERLKWAAVWILVFQLVDMYWNILPGKVAYGEENQYFQREFSVALVDLFVLVGAGALVIWAFLRSFHRYRPIPIRDPRILESINCHE